MEQIARNLIDCLNGFLLGYGYLINHPVSYFTAQFQNILNLGCIKPIKRPPRSPSLNALLKDGFRRFRAYPCSFQLNFRICEFVWTAFVEGRSDRPCVASCGKAMEIRKFFAAPDLRELSVWYPRGLLAGTSRIYPGLGLSIDFWTWIQFGGQFSRLGMNWDALDDSKETVIPLTSF